MYDLVVIGAGPGGYVGAIRAAQLGFKTACIEKGETLGGTCLNVGCIPSKALLQSSEHFWFLKNHSKEHGLNVGDLSVDFNEMMKRKEEVVKGLTNGVKSLFKQHKIDWIQGEATFIDQNTLAVGDQKVDSKNILIATGSEPISLPFLPIDEKRILSSTGALALTEIPKRFVVVGGGIIGLELGSVFARLGSEVTIIEMLPEIGSGLDAAIQRQLHQLLTKQGIKILVNTKVQSANIDKNPIEINVGTETILADKILVAVGRRPYTKNLQFPVNDKGRIEINDRFQTLYPNVYAIGDVVEGPMLAHKASEEAVVAVEIMANLPSKINYMTVPNIVYTSPEAVSIGFTEKEALDRGLEIIKGQCSFKAVSRARCMGETDGLIKLIGLKSSGLLIGYHIIGPNASELAAEGVMALKNRMTLKEIGHAIHGHPTLSEGIKEAALNAYSEQIHF